MACSNGWADSVSMLLSDPRIDANRPGEHNSSPLWYATQNGHLLVVQHLLASDFPVNTTRLSNINHKTAAEQGRRMVPFLENKVEYQRKATGGPIIAKLIDEYQRDPDLVRQRMRQVPGVREHFIGLTFAILVFYSDSFLRARPTASQAVTRFLNIGSRLPIDLQMVVCNRLFGSPKDVITSKFAEPGYRWLTRPTIPWEAPVYS